MIYDMEEQRFRKKTKQNKKQLSKALSGWCVDDLEAGESTRNERDAVTVEPQVIR